MSAKHYTAMFTEYRTVNVTSIEMVQP